MIVYVVTDLHGNVLGVFTKRRKAMVVVETEQRNGVVCQLSEVEVNESVAPDETGTDTTETS